MEHTKHTCQLYHVIERPDVVISSEEVYFNTVIRKFAKFCQKPDETFGYHPFVFNFAHKWSSHSRLKGNGKIEADAYRGSDKEDIELYCRQTLEQEYFKS